MTQNALEASNVEKESLLRHASFVFKKKSNKKKSEIFYKVKNHQELFQVGSSFYSDFKKGLRSFAFISPNLPDSQQKTILGLASFFSYHEDLTMLIISQNLGLEYFKNMISGSKESFIGIPDENGPKITYYDHPSFDFLDFKELYKIKENSEVTLEECLDSMVGRYDLVLWDVPNLEAFKADSSIFFPVSRLFGNISIILKVTKSKVNEIKGLQEFFDQYGVVIKGVLIDK